MHTEPRWAAIDRIYLHTNEGPQEENGAANLGGYLNTIDAGYHFGVDDKNTIRYAADNVVVWAEGGDNGAALSIVMIGRAAQDWTTPYSLAEIERCAQQVATWCKQYNVPAIRVLPAPPGAAPTSRGIAEHADDHSPASEGHTDPGVGFPIDAFIKRVHDILVPPVDWQALKLLVDWQKRAAAHPLRLGQNSPDVLILSQLLAHRGMPGVIGFGYGVKITEGVAWLKALWANENRDGTVVGGPFAEKLITHP
jgi:hypothetical protein